MVKPEEDDPNRFSRYSLSRCRVQLSPTTQEATSELRGRASPASSPRDNTRSNTNSNRRKKDFKRLVSWSRYLEKWGDEEAVERAEEWMIDLSHLYLGQRFASGAHSRLYHGTYQGKAVAVKVTKQREDDQQQLIHTLDRLFNREIVLLSGLHHPNIVQFLGACSKPPVRCVITEYCCEGSLREFLRKRACSLLPLSIVLSMALDIARGMEYLHSKGVIHRDLKSDNLLLDENLRVKITDFGVARIKEEGDAVEEKQVADMGTYRWMAPEMVNKNQEEHSNKVDVYSYGIVLWEIVTTRLPFEDMSPVQAAYAVVHKDARPEFPSNCPLLLKQLMQRCWSPSPANRPSFGEIVESLEAPTAPVLHSRSCTTATISGRER